jgi:hypothetical protein
MYDYENIRDSIGWSTLHCCKIPYHQELVGYTKNLDPNHPCYAYIICGNRMALNLVDLDIFNSKYLEYKYNMFKTAFNFLDRELGKKQNVLIHCNEGYSRSPMILLMYLAYKGINNYDKLTFEEAVHIFGIENNYKIMPKGDMYLTTRMLWNRFTKNKVNM